jgi:hypothetical protein
LDPFRFTRLRYFCILAAAEGLLALVFLFRIPSEPGRALLLGYSTVRVLLGLATLALTAALAWAAWQPEPVKSHLDDMALEAAMAGRGALLPATVTAGLAFLLLGLWALTFSSPPFYRSIQDALVQLPPWTVHAVDLLRAVYQRAAPLLAWGTLLGLQTLVLFLLEYRAAYHMLWREGAIGRAALTVVMLLAALFYAAVLLLRLKLFLAIQNWKWYYMDRSYQPSLRLYAAILALGVLGGLIALRWFRRWPALALVLLIGLGYALQVGFGYLDGQGFESLRLKYADSIFNGYAKAAAEQPPLFTALREYEARYGPDDYLGTKPPGVLLVYSLVEKISNALHPEPTADARFLRLTELIAHGFPLLAGLALIPLYTLARRLSGKEDALLPALLYITAPSFLLVPVFLDQALYPLLFTACLALALAAMDRRSPGLAFALGVGLYACLYFSFSLLPLVPLVLAWVVVDAWLNPQPQLQRAQKPHGRFPWKRTALLLAALLGGMLVIAFLLRVGLNFDILLRYRNAFAEHRTTHVFNSFWERAANAMVLNNAEFTSFAGFALITLLLVRSVRAIVNILRSLVTRINCSTRLDGLLLVFLVAYFGTNLFGQTVGEVQRLFLFFLPLCALFAADEARRLFRARASGYALLVGAQLTTAMLIFMLQDWYG